MLYSSSPFLTVALLSHSMLYPTHHHHSPHFSSLSPHLFSSPSPHFQGMESVQEDVRSGFVPAAAVAVGMDEFLGVSGGAAAGDDFFVDELLDFSNGYSETEEQLEEQQETEMGKTKMSPVFQEKQAAAPRPEKSSLSGNEDFGSLHESELSVEAEGLESLEWLSHFVEDSFSDYSLPGKLPPSSAENRPEAPAPAPAQQQEQPCFTTPVQTKARTKRARAEVRIWPVLPPSFAEPSTSSSSSTSSTTSFPPSYLSQPDDSSLGNAPAKKQKRKLADRGGGAAAQPRRCSHCGVTKTPQWRAGPLGSKTLCNACGVRYKSGRLLPEYRPACSPTFSSEMHSNNHRKVLEMRRKKELEMEAAGLPPPVQSF